MDNQTSLIIYTLLCERMCDIAVFPSQVICMHLHLARQVALIAKGDVEFGHVLNVTNREYRAVKQALVSEDHTRAAIVAEEVRPLLFFFICQVLPVDKGLASAFFVQRCISIRNTLGHSKNVY